MGGQVYLTECPNLKTVLLSQIDDTIEFRELKLDKLIFGSKSDVKCAVLVNSSVKNCVIGEVSYKPLSGALELKEK